MVLTPQAYLELAKAGFIGIAALFAYRQGSSTNPEKEKLFVETADNENTQSIFKPSLYDPKIPAPINISHQHINYNLDVIKKTLSSSNKIENNLYLNEGSNQNSQKHQPQPQGGSGSNPEIDPDKPNKKDNSKVEPSNQIKSDFLNEISKKVKDIGPDSKVNGLFTIDEIVNVITKAVQFRLPNGTPIKIDWWHILGGTYRKGKFTGFHFDPGAMIRLSGLLNIINRAGSNIEKHKDVAIYSWSLNNPLFEQMRSSFSTVFEGTLEELIIMYQEGFDILHKNWDTLVTPRVIDGVAQEISVPLQSGYSLILNKLNVISGTLPSAYTAAQKIGLSFIGALAFNSAEASQSQIAEESEKAEASVFTPQISEIEENLIEDSAIDNISDPMSPEAKVQGLQIIVETMSEQNDSHGNEIPSQFFDIANFTANPDLTQSFSTEEKTNINPFKIDHTNHIYTLGQNIVNNYKIAKAQGEDLRSRFIPEIDQKLDVTYRVENVSLQDLLAEEITFMSDNFVLAELSINPHSDFSKEFIAYYKEIASILLSTNSIKPDVDLIFARYKMLYSEPGDDDFVGREFRKTRMALLPFYFHEDGSPKFFLEEDASEIIAKYLKAVSFNQPHYIDSLKNALNEGLFAVRKILNREQKVQSADFRKKESSVWNCFKNLIEYFWSDNLEIARNNPINLLYKDVLTYLLNSEWEKAAAIIDEAKVCGHHKDTLKQLYRTQFYKFHNPSGINHLFINDPLVLAMSKEQLLAVSSSYIKLSQLNNLLARRYILANEWKKIFKIREELSNSKLKYYLYLFSSLSQNQEKAIDSLMSLSSDTHDQDNLQIFNTFFNEQGILKNLENKPILKQFSIPTTLATQEAKELRQYLNYLLTFQVDENSEPRISAAIENILEASRNLNTSKYQAGLDNTKAIYQSLKN